MNISSLMFLISSRPPAPAALDRLYASPYFWPLLAVFHVLIIAALIFPYAKLINIHKKSRNTSRELYDTNRILAAFINAETKIAYLKDENLKYVMGNQALYDFMKKDKSEILGHDDYELFSKELAEPRRKTDLMVLKSCTAYSYEHTIGDNIVQILKFPVLLPNGKYGVGSLVNDVTTERMHERSQAMLLKRTAILVEVSGMAFSNPKEQLNYVLTKLLELTDSKYGSIYLISETSPELSLFTWVKREGAEDINPEPVFRLDTDSIWTTVIQQRKAVVVNNFEDLSPLHKQYNKENHNFTKCLSAPIIIDNKIVALAGLADKESDYDNGDVSNLVLVLGGLWQAMQRRIYQEQLFYERNKYRQTLISIGDGVMVVDKDGYIEMLNNVASELTGWSDQEARGRYYKEVFRLSHENPLLGIQDPIERALSSNMSCGLSDNTVLTSRDGRTYYLEDSASPVYNENNECVGVVLVFRDVTQKREQLKKIEFLSYHDQLTGLYNRGFFEEEMSRLDTERNYPISILMGDVNGLKLANDVFGHAYGDQLLKTLAQVFNSICRADDIIARWGGDEFVMLLPRTSKRDAENIAFRIKDEFSSLQVKAIKGSISIGISTKTDKNQDINDILASAEEIMYSVKTLERESFSEEEIDIIIGMLHTVSPEEKEHSESLSKLCYKLGRHLGLNEIDLRNLKEAGYYHDIGKVTLAPELLEHHQNFTKEELSEIRKHSLVGYRILNSTDRTVGIADAVLSHHEHWDGTGYPVGLKGDEIPLLSRIIAVVEYYDRLRKLPPFNKEDGEAACKTALLNQAGKILDPHIVKAFIHMLENENS